ncbi:hypothetical protein K8R32_04010 [bacterium]|nr:hypothetical protein [bacterium]
MYGSLTCLPAGRKVTPRMDTKLMNKSNNYITYEFCLNAHAKQIFLKQKKYAAVIEDSEILKIK